AELEGGRAFKSFGSETLDILLHGEHADIQSGLLNAKEMLADLLERRDYGKAIREIGSLADFVNQYTDRYKPWDLAKNSEKNDELHRVC
ncbi:hypothetical protein ABTJ90_19790, partial [Acinetobacter baumannii]